MVESSVLCLNYQGLRLRCKLCLIDSKVATERRLNKDVKIL